MKKLLVTSLVLATLSVAVQNTLADTSNGNTKGNTATQNAMKKTWLGVSLAPVPKALTQQLGDLIPKNQGVMIQSVSPNSPASKAGLQAYDVLLSFNDQQLYSAQQLAGLVSSSIANSNVKLSVVRHGKKQDISVKLDTHTIIKQPRVPMMRHPFFGFNRQPFGRPFMQPQPFFQPSYPQQPALPLGKQGKVNIMQQFESISIKQTGDGTVHAEVSFENNGDKKEFTFDGKYDEVRKQIQETKDLPEDKKNSLLNALQNKPNKLMPDNFFKDFQIPTPPSFDNFFDQQPPMPSWFNNRSKL